MDGSARGGRCGPPRKLHPNGETGPTSFTEMTGFKAVRLAVMRWMSAGVQSRPLAAGGPEGGAAGGSEEGLAAAALARGG